MDALNDNKLIKEYMRFLKNEGIYHRAMSIHGSHIPFSGRRQLNEEYVVHSKSLIESALKTLNTYSNRPGQFISNCLSFCDWSYTKEGRGYWYAKSILWRWYLYKSLNRNETCDFKYHIRNILCDFSDKLTKDTTLRLKNILKEIR